MTTDIEDLIGGTEPQKLVRGHRWKRATRGPLHDLLTRALPDLVDERSQIVNLHKLAEALSLTYQGVYKWFKPGRKNQIAANQVERIVQMSRNQKTGGADFKPVTNEDFWEFLPR